MPHLRRKLSPQCFTFNRTSVELKQKSGNPTHRLPRLAFNRTSVELKQGYFAYALAFRHSFNRTSVELKRANQVQEEC